MHVVAPIHVVAPMHVVATAGHVDHGKSTLVRALTGMEPDRWAEERRRGMTIDLGFAWTTLESGRTVAFVDVPGHERFVGTMLAGVGPVPAVVLVVAADEGWMPQSTEHVDALSALGVREGLLVITRSDLMAPELALADAGEHLAGTPLAGVPAVTVAATTGAGLPALRTALDALVARLPAPDGAADVRLWVDRAFTIRAPAPSSPARWAPGASGWTTSWSSRPRTAGAGWPCAGCSAWGRPSRRPAAWPGWPSTCAGSPARP